MSFQLRTRAHDQHLKIKEDYNNYSKLQRNRIESNAKLKTKQNKSHTQNICSILHLKFNIKHISKNLRYLNVDLVYTFFLIPVTQSFLFVFR